MKLRWKIAGALLILAVAALIVVATRPSPALRDLEATRRKLQREGFKIDLRDFDLSLSPELSARAAMLGRTTRGAITNRTVVAPFELAVRDLTPLMEAISSNAAVVVWKLDQWQASPPRSWPSVAEALAMNQSRLDAALHAAVSGPIRFQPIGYPAPNPLLPYLADLKNLETTFAAATMNALHNGNKTAAWSNLLASTCLVTSYEPEPIMICHMVRFGCAGIAFETLWNALQASGWSDAQLADLQQRWEAVDFLKRLPDTAAWSRADTALACQWDRRQSSPVNTPVHIALKSPQRTFYELRYRWQRVRYRNQGTYEDERDALLYFRDRELELRRAVQSPAWSEMRQLPGVTNAPPFASRRPGGIATMISMRQMAMNLQNQGHGLLGRAAEAETRRRIIVTALALARYRLRNGVYPNALQQLVPELLGSAPIDFMDGRLLRYHLTPDGHFVLYSVGLDCADDGGEMRRGAAVSATFAQTYGVRGPASTQGKDLVWPRPASAEETGHLQEERAKAELEQAQAAKTAEAEAEWRWTSLRQAKLEKILQSPPHPAAKDIRLHGHLLSELLHNEAASGTNRLALSELLRLKPVSTAAEPEVVTFELPIKYDALTNIGTLHLYVDPLEDEDADEGCEAGSAEVQRATNGNCRILWHTIYESPGRHALVAGLELNGPTKDDPELVGPLIQFVVTNLCQFSASSATFEPQIGVLLAARLLESNGTYQVEFKSTDGQLLKTVADSTTNGTINVHWNLIGDQGQHCTNQAFDTLLHLTLPDSGRSQTLRGP